MLVVESSMAGGRKEVALATIAVITTVMQAHGTTKAVSRRYAHSIRPTDYFAWPSALSSIASSLVICTARYQSLVYCLMSSVLGSRVRA